jgi:putative endonuclease
MQVTTLDIGKQAEQLACHHLEQQGLRLLTTNYRSRYGEIDLIMRDRDTIVFVEVRSRKQGNLVDSLASIDRHKQRKLIRTAQFYLLVNPTLAKQPARFDVIAITQQTDVAQIDWIKDAFQT